jgi:hypothetical protein
VDVTGIPGVCPTELLSNAAVCLQDSVCIKDAGSGSHVLTHGDLMGADKALRHEAWGGVLLKVT